jgi:hypothetical protein
MFPCAQVMDDPSFFHQWQSDALLEQYTEQQIAVAFGQGEVDQAAAALMAPQQCAEPAAAAEHRPRKAAKVNTGWEWDSCITEQVSPVDSSSPTILSFVDGHTAFAEAEVQVPSAPYCGSAAAPVKAPKQDRVDAAFHARPVKRSYDAMVAAEAQVSVPSRPVSQNQDHILAERKRREKLSQHLIALSKIVPGIKKVKYANKH